MWNSNRILVDLVLIDVFDEVVDNLVPVAQPTSVVVWAGVRLRPVEVLNVFEADPLDSHDRYLHLHERHAPVNVLPLEVDKQVTGRSENPVALTQHRLQGTEERISLQPAKVTRGIVTISLTAFVRWRGEDQVNGRIRQRIHRRSVAANNSVPQSHENVLRSRLPKTTKAAKRK